MGLCMKDLGPIPDVDDASSKITEDMDEGSDETEDKEEQQQQETTDDNQGLEQQDQTGSFTFIDVK